MAQEMPTPEGANPQDPLRMSGHPESESRTTVDSRFTQGMGALHSGRLEESIHCFKDLVRIELERQNSNPESGDSILRKMKEGEEGLSLALDRQPYNFEAYTHRMVIRLSRAIYDSLTGGEPGPDCKNALLDASKAVDLRTEDVRARVNRANVLLFSARFARDSGKDVRSIFDLARNDLDYALRIEPAHATALHNRGISSFYMASLDKKQGTDPTGHYTRAIEDLRRASEVDPSYPYLHKDLGVCRVALARVLLERGERPKDLLKTAVGDLTLAIDTNPRLYGAFYERGMGFFSLKQFEASIADWEKCLEIDSSKRKHLEPLISEAKKKLATKSGG